MKKLISNIGVILLVVVVCMTACERTEAVDPPQETPTAHISEAVKIYSGGTPSIRIKYRLTNTTQVQKTLIANFNFGFSGATNAEVPTVDGEATVWDHGNWETKANYYFIFQMKDGTQTITTIQTFFF